MLDYSDLYIGQAVKYVTPVQHPDADAKILEISAKGVKLEIVEADGNISYANFCHRTTLAEHVRGCFYTE